MLPRDRSNVYYMRVSGSDLKSSSLPQGKMIKYIKKITANQSFYCFGILWWFLISQIEALCGGCSFHKEEHLSKEMEYITQRFFRIMRH